MCFVLRETSRENKASGKSLKSNQERKQYGTGGRRKPTVSA